MPQPAAQVPDHARGQVDQALGDAGGVHDRRGENEERDGEQRERVDRGARVLRDRDQHQLALRRERREGTEHEGEGHGYLERDQAEGNGHKDRCRGLLADEGAERRPERIDADADRCDQHQREATGAGRPRLPQRVDGDQQPADGDRGMQHLHGQTKPRRHVRRPAHQPDAFDQEYRSRGDARGVDEQAMRPAAPRTEQAREHLDRDVSAATGGDPGCNEDRPDEGQLGELLGPGQRVVERVAVEDLKQRDRRRERKERRGDGIEHTVR